MSEVRSSGKWQMANREAVVKEAKRIEREERKRRDRERETQWARNSNETRPTRDRSTSSDSQILRQFLTHFFNTKKLKVKYI